jgi:antitoxin (DNA-binding transcriptional repressor) of toxin-antitoxin stability system
MVQVTVEQAISEFGRLLEEVGQGEEFVIVQGDAPLARLSPILMPRQPGSAVGIITYVAEDFDAPLEEFEDYQ